MASALRAVSSGFVVSFIAVACGGVSELDPNFGVGPMGSLTGGSTGSGGAPLSGGKQGAGGNSNNGSGGKAATGPTGGVFFSTGGAAGAGGKAASGGARAAGGSLAVGGTPGSGTGGTPPIPVPPELAAQCDLLCVRQTAAQCAIEDDYAGCITGCRLFVNANGCATPYQNYFSCAQKAGVYCNNQGKADFAGCEGQEVTAQLCVLNAAMDPALQQPCVKYCTTRNATFCPNNGTISDCTLGCALYGGASPTCTDEWQAYLACAQTSAFACNANGEGEAQNCTLQGLAFYGCILTAASGMP
ncbi:MAG: hypothetical protein SFV15_25070 [Polyangiaceae bacterium]|nr:hypothetical protein [Polyangiaceae bacterium]